MTDLFISYSRADRDFAEKLHTAVKNSGRDAWLDKFDIPKAEKFWQEIEDGIDGADSFIFVLSPDSVMKAGISEEYCCREIEHAIKRNKRIIPIVYKHKFDLDNEVTSHRTIKERNWIDFSVGQEFEIEFRELLKTIDTDLIHVKAHTRILKRAVEWQNQTNNDSFLLRGTDLESAEYWLSKGFNKNPQPTELHGKYINASRQAETSSQKSEVERQKNALIRVSIGLVIATISAGVAFFQYQQSEQRRLDAEITAQSLIVGNLSDSGYDLEALLEGLRLGQRLQQMSSRVRPEVRLAAIANFRQVVFGVHEKNRWELNQGGRSSHVSLSPDGETIATASSDRIIKLWRYDSKEIMTLKGRLKSEYSSFVSVDFSPNGNLILAESSDDTTWLWNRAGKEIAILEGATPVFSPNGDTVATGSKDGTIRVWSIEGKELLSLKAYQSAVEGISFSPNGKMIAAVARNNNVIKVWDKNGKELLNLSLRRTPKAVGEGEEGGSISPFEGE
jgi:TIR domain/Anaphase-promoting complex subunit 4 WD40 domain/WD domain, G-beta repeat